MPESGGYASHPAVENSPTISGAFIRIIPAANNQKLTEFRNGNATSRDPI